MSSGRFLGFCRVFICFVILASLGEARAQAGGEGGNNDFSFFLGYMFPNSIDNVTEVMPVFGGRYGFAMPFGVVEGEFTNTHSEGVDFTTFGANLRGDINLGQGLTALVYGGPDFHYYIPRGSTSRQTDLGVHFGVGGLMHVTDTLWLRTDLKFHGNPGTAMYLLFGVMFRSPTGGP